MTAQKILLIDDEADIRECVRLMVGHTGKFEFDQASNGVEGLEKIMHNKYDCVVSDIRMPGMDGVEMLKKVRALGNNVPILFISAFADDEFEYKVTDYGAVKLIHKIDIKDVATQVHEALKVGRDVKDITASQTFGADFLKLLNNT